MGLKKISQNAARLAFAGTAVFLLLLAVLHVLEPEFDPSWRMISEYELGSYGWMMRLAFFSWGLGCLALAVALWPYVQDTGGRLGLVLLAAVAIIGAGAGVFITDPITAPADTMTTSGYLHSICGLIFIFGFPIVATLIGWGLARNKARASMRRWLLVITALPWIGFLAFVASLIIFMPSISGYGPEVRIGWPNRLMAVSYAAWLMISAWFTGRHLSG
jgi:hypothetical protein